MSQRLLVPVITVADALLAVVLGVVIPLLCTTAIWVAAGMSGDWTLSFAAAVGAWALSLGGDLVVTHDDTMLAPLGLSEPVAFEIGFAPLALTLATVIPALRSGARFRLDESPLALAALGPIAFAAAAWGLGAAASHANVAIDSLGTALLGGVIYLAALAVGARVWERVPDEVVELRTAGWGRGGIGAMVRGVGIMLAGLVAGGALLVTVGMLLGFGRILAAFEALHLDVVGAVAFGLGQLAILPNAILWAVSWMLGPGFAIGDGSSIAPIATNVGPLPLVPLLGAVPEGIPPFAIVLVVLPVAIGVLAGLAMRLAPGADDWNVGWRRLATPIVAAVVASLAIALLGLFSGGAVGPGRLATTGPEVGWMLLAAIATLAVGALTGAYVPLADAVEPAAGRADRAGTSTSRAAAGGRAADTSALDDDSRDEEDWDDDEGDWDDDDWDEDDEDDDWDDDIDGDEDEDGQDGPDDDGPKSRGRLVEKARAARSRLAPARDGRGDDGPTTPRRASAATTPRTPRDDTEPDIYAGIDPLADE
ncbi:hypothetical protein GCM10011490_12380 [Pseudoclavibacter endophyticus]|uniref:Uncharacterized protein n=1 Tax=Pseudoclavibacter endophyticus TaxID=1778590 RepID=A0A6H9WQW3_9MICO|nr:DUF6350 family protein [Pseudoclavibacter endophyticus]KAB1649347.1 hypothetical protein F8O04_03500 [Pseudoclavibacter endophyticus]GGA63303.1 hypothetical protein GCM10011490_12380 [Pseudoclavibacter endophyticus]